MKEYRYTLTTVWADDTVKVENCRDLALAIGAMPIYYATGELVEATIHDFELDKDVLTYNVD